MTAEITLRGPGDVVTALPYQLGYQPEECAVLVALDGRRVALVARCDLPPDDDVGATAEALTGPVLREGLGRVVLVGYERVAQTSRPVLTALVERLESEQVEVLDVAVVRDGRRFSATCSEPCCPPEGAPLPDPAEVPAVAELVARGRAPLASRAEVDRLVEADPAASRGVAALLRRRTRPPRPEVAARAWALVLAPPPAGGSGRLARPWARHVVADAAQALADIGFRDGLIGWLVPGVLPRGDLDAEVLARLERSLPRWGGMGRWSSPLGAEVEGRELVLERLLTLCAAVPDDCPEVASAVCTVAAHVAWSDGEGAIARAALGRALRLAPGYRLAGLLARLVEHGVRFSSAGAAGGRTPGGGSLGRVG